MLILAWPLSAVAITLVAWLLRRVANRPKPPLSSEESMQEHQRLLRVLETPVPAPPPARRR